MKTSTIVANALGPTAWHPANTYGCPFELVVATATGDASLTYSVEYTYVNVLAGNDPVGDEVFVKEAAATAASEAIFEMPVAAVRLNVTAYTSGTAVARVIQSGP